MYDSKYSAVSEEHKKFLMNNKRKNSAIGLSRFIILILLFFLWETAASKEWIDPFIMSQPSRIIKTIVIMSKDGSLFMHTGITVYETIIGFVSGTVIGTLVAIALWWSDFLAKVLDPYLVVLNALPKTALGPIILVWIGGTTKSIVVMALLLSIVVTIINVFTGFSNCDEDKIKLLKTFGANKRQILRKVVFPAGIPTIISTLKINVGLSLVGVIVGEFLVSKAGLGHLIIYGGQVFKMDLVM
ncbi:ABC transporter permease, partial [Lutispora sp.]|uniref:ABC transporter permease n=1 Tax=Lutispora sp. TaxID=2828727 RepID=UPI002B2071A6